MIRVFVVIHSLITLALHPPQSAIAWRVLADCLSLIAMTLLPPPSAITWRNWLTQLTTLPDIFYSISLLLTLLDIYHYDMYNKRTDLKFTDKNPHEVCVFEIARMKCLKYVNFEEFSYLSEYQHVTHLTYHRLKKRAPKPQLLGVESLGLMR